MEVAVTGGKEEVEDEQWKRGCVWFYLFKLGRGWACVIGPVDWVRIWWVKECKGFWVIMFKGPVWFID